MTAPRPWMLVLAGGVALSLVYFLLPAGPLRAAVYLGLATAPLVLLVVRLRQASLLRRRPWSFLIAGLALYTLSLFLWYLVPLSSGEPLPFPSPLDGLFFCSYLLYALFLLGALRRRIQLPSERSGTRALPLIDAGIFTVAAVGILWPVLFLPVWRAGASALDLLVAACYPLLTAVLFGLAAQLLTTGRRLGGEEVLLALWVAGELVGVTVYGVVSAAGDFHFGHPMVLAWMVSYTALAAAAVHPSLTERRSDPGGPLTARRWWSWLLLPVVLSPMMAGLAAGALESGPELAVTRAVLMGLTVAGIILAFVRLHLVSGDLAEERRLTDELAGLTRRLEHQSLHDALTGLGNRRLLMERLGHAIRQRPRHPEARTGLLLLDLDGFKAVNDALGHDCGDEVLIEVARRLSATLRPGDTLVRLGGDEFAVVLEQVEAAQAAGAAARVVESLRAPITVAGQEVSVWASLGIELAEQHADPGVRLKNADLAMYAAKSAGGDRYEFFDDAMRETVLARLRLDRDLRVAAASGELRLVYQPVVDLRTARTIGVEALVRWAHPTKGLLLPGAFIEPAEESGAVVGMGRWVLEEACRQAVRWTEEGGMPDGFQMAVNVSRRQLLEPGLVEMVASVVDRAGIPPGQICLEVTETALFADVHLLTRTLRDLKSVGVTIAMDDFGTGYSSLEQLRHLPIDVLKIDRAFVSRIDQRPEDYALATAIVRLATSLGKTTLAEGVETPAQLAHLRALRVDHAQGYLFARPLEPDDVLAAVRAPGVAGHRS